jgi:hypothetical protein
MKNQTLIYADNDVCHWHITQLGGIPTQDITAKLAVYHVPYPYEVPGEHFESRIDQSIIHSDRIVVLCSELHEITSDFVRRYQNPKIKFFLCGAVEGIKSSDWMDWFITSSYFYKTNPVKVLDRLTPYQIKPKTFDILLGQYREHRTLIHDYINHNNLNDQVLMTYINYQEKISADGNSGTWFWEDEGLEIIDTDLKWTVGQVRYYGQQMSLSQVVPIQAYSQTAFSVVAETNFANDYVFHTEKIVKPILARRLFIVYGGHNYLKNLQRLGFKTFSNVIDESYDNEPDYKHRGDMICKQISYLLQQDQQQVLDAIQPIVEHNHNLMINTDWYRNFSKELRAVLLDRTN